MTIKELAHYCKSINIDCDRCEHKSECQKMSAHLEDISPCGVVQMVEENRDTQALWMPRASCTSAKAEEFCAAWDFLMHHKMFRGLFSWQLWLGVVKVNPDTNEIDNDITKNIKLKFGWNTVPTTKNFVRLHMISI